MDRSAWLSECQKYRYTLARTWRKKGLLFAYFGINPSTADANIDDATVKKWIGFTERNGGRGFIVGNVFSYRATNVKELAKCHNPTGGMANASHILTIIKKADVLVPCWGNASKVPAHLRHNISDLMSLLIESGKPIKIFGKTKSGDPRHPLMLSYNTPLIGLQAKPSSDLQYEQNKAKFGAHRAFELGSEGE